MKIIQTKLFLKNSILFSFKINLDKTLTRNWQREKMSADPRIKHIKIQTGVVKRYKIPLKSVFCFESDAIEWTFATNYEFLVN